MACDTGTNGASRGVFPSRSMGLTHESLSRNGSASTAFSIESRRTTVFAKMGGKAMPRLKGSPVTSRTTSAEALEQPRKAVLVAKVLCSPVGQALTSMEEARIFLRDRILVPPRPATC